MLLATNVFAAEKLLREYTLSFTADRETRVKIDHQDTALHEISIKAAVDVEKAPLNVYSAPDAPDGKEAPGEVYSYIKIEKKFSDSFMKSATITAKVEKSWLSEKGISQTNVVIYDYDISGWKALATKEVNNDADYFYFKATVDDLGYFGISTKAEVTETSTTKTKEKNETVTEVKEEEKKEEETKTEEVKPVKEVISEPITTVEKKEIEWNTVWVSAAISGIVAAIVSAIVVLSMHGKKGIEKEDEEDHIRKKVEQQMSRKEEKEEKQKRKQDEDDDVYKYAR